VVWLAVYHIAVQAECLARSSKYQKEERTRVEYNRLQRKILRLRVTKLYATDHIEQLASVLADAHVSLNPHLVEAALFDFRSPFSKGAILPYEAHRPRNAFKTPAKSHGYGTSACSMGTRTGKDAESSTCRVDFQLRQQR
jgi:hypothetical protein